MVTKKKAAPVQEVVAEDEVILEVGGFIEFVAYGPDIPETEHFLTPGEQYEIIEITENGNPVVRFDNPDFNPKQKVHDEKNPKTMDVEVYPEEYAIVADEAAEDDAEEVAEEVVEEAPAPAAKKGKAKAAPAPAPAAKTAKTAAKGKAAPAAKKGKVAKPAPAEQVEEDEDALPELDYEDAAVLELVNSSEDLIGTAQELEAQVGTTEFQLGGILYHIRKDKKHHELEGEGTEVYKEKGGFGKFLQDYMNIEYRKALYLIEIYANFSLANIENAAQKVAEIGWTKASKIAKLLNEEGQNPEELIELAQQNTVADLSEAIKDTTTVGGTGGSKGTAVKRLTLKFRYLEAEAQVVDQILEGAKEQLGLKDIGEALLHILTDWNTTNGGEVAQQEAPKQTAPRTAAKTGARRATAKA